MLFVVHLLRILHRSLHILVDFKYPQVGGGLAELFVRVCVCVAKLHFKLFLYTKQTFHGLPMKLSHISRNIFDGASSMALHVLDSSVHGRASFVFVITSK